MQLRTQQSQNSIQNLLNSLQLMLRSFNINFHQCDVFEETILKLAGVKQFPHACRFHSNHPQYLDKYKDSRDYCFFNFDLTQESVETLLRFNHDYPELDITNITSESTPFILNGYETVMIRMNADALRIYILPLLKNYLDTHPADMLRHQAFSLSEDTFFYTVAKEFKGYGIDFVVYGENLFTFEKLLCQLIEENRIRASLLVAQFDLILPTALIRVIAEYLNVSEEDRIPADDKKNSHPPVEVMHTYPFNKLIFMKLHIATQDAKPIKNFFNRIYHHSTEIQAKADTNGPLDFDNMAIRRGTLVHPGFVSDMQDLFVQETLRETDKELQKVIMHINDDKNHPTAEALSLNVALIKLQNHLKTAGIDENLFCLIQLASSKLGVLQSERWEKGFFKAKNSGLNLVKLGEVISHLKNMAETFQGVPSRRCHGSMS